MKTNGKTIVVNGRSYNPPERPTAVICLDGSEPGLYREGHRSRRSARPLRGL